MCPGTDVGSVITASASLAELAQHGARELAPYAGRPRPPETSTEWLGIAVARVPELTARARAADEIDWGRQAAHAGAPQIAALHDAIAGSAALCRRALECHLEHPHEQAARIDHDVEAYAALLVAAHQSAPERAEFLIAGHASFLGGAVEASGALAEAELAVARARRWERSDPARLVEERSTQLHSAIVNALGGLLAYARLTAEATRQPR